MQQSQILSAEQVKKLTPLIVNGAITSSKDDKRIIAEARTAITANEKFAFTAFIKMVGSLDMGCEREDSVIKAKPDWESACLKLYGLATPYAKSEIRKILEDTKDGSKVDQSTLNLKECAIMLKDIKDEVVGYRPNSPLINVRCGYEILDETIIEKLENPLDTQSVDDIIDMT
jgi:hypothetical protein